MTSARLAAVPAPHPLARLLTPREVADMLRVSTGMVRALTRRGELSAAYIGRCPRYAPDDVADYLARARGGRS